MVLLCCAQERCPDVVVVGVDPVGSILALPDHLNDQDRLCPYKVRVSPQSGENPGAPSRLCRDARSIVIYDYGMQDYEYINCLTHTISASFLFV